MKPLPSCPSCGHTIPFTQSFSRIGRLFICRNCSERLVVPRPFIRAMFLMLAAAALIVVMMDDRKTLAFALLAAMALVPLIMFLVTPVRRHQ